MRLTGPVSSYMFITFRLFVFTSRSVIYELSPSSLTNPASLDRSPSSLSSLSLSVSPVLSPPSSLLPEVTVIACWPLPPRAAVMVCSSAWTVSMFSSELSMKARSSASGL